MIERITAAVATAGLLVGCSPEQPAPEYTPPQKILEVAQDYDYFLVNEGLTAHPRALKTGEKVVGICIEKLAPLNDPFQTGAFIAAKSGQIIRTTTFINEQGLRNNLYKDYSEEKLAQQFPPCDAIIMEEAEQTAITASREVKT